MYLNINTSYKAKMKFAKRIVAFVLVLVLVITLLPLSQASAASKKMRLNKTKATIYVGKTIKLKVKNKKNKKVKWKSKNKKVATVTKKGKVKAKKAGKATIIAKVGKKTFKCKITVKKKKTTNKKPVATTKPNVTTVPVTTQKATTNPVTTAKPTVPVETTVTTEPSTATPTVTVEQPTSNPGTAGRPVNNSLTKPQGLTYAGNNDLPYYFAWAPVAGASSYEVYVNGKRVEEVSTNAVNLSASVFINGAGTYTIGVGAVFGNEVSSPMTIEYTYVTSEVTTTTANVQQPTSAGGSQQPGNDGTFTTDSSIAKPFGLLVESPENGMVRVVWGRGTIDCYNVYVDGERRRTAVQAQELLLPVYFEGTHEIAITTVVGNRESEKITASVAVVGVGEKETEPETCPPELVPQLREDLSLRDDKILMQLNNKTDGEYEDSEVYWCLLGYNANNQLCYLDKNGNLIPATTDMNTLTVSGREVADVSYTLEEADYVYVPSIISGRMYFSYEKPVYITFNQAADGRIGFAGPDLNNPSDPNANTLFEFAEFTIDGKYFWGNTTRVDYFSFPMVTRLVGHTQYETYDRTVGDIGTRDEIFAAFKENAPAPFKTLVGDKRIIAPCKGDFNAGKTYGNYFDSYIDEFWTKYASEDLVFKIDGITYTGRSNGNVMNFTKAGDSTVYTVSKPNTQEVLEGKGAFATGNSVELVIESELCAAFNRGVATEPSKWRKASEYYKNDINNYYAGFFHEHSIVGRAYGFCYDDVNDQSTLLQYGNSDALIIDLKW